MKVKPNLPFFLYKIANTLYGHHIPLLPFIIRQFMRGVFSAIIPYEAKIGKNVHFGYNGLGIVIHRKCVIGDNVLFYQQVTLGGGRGDGVPVIGSNVVLGAGAEVIGNVTIGDNAKIGANAVVLTDVPAYATAVGVPAKIKIRK